MKEPKVFISVLNWKAPGNTAKTIKSVLLSDYKNYEILILDNYSADGSVPYLNSLFPSIKLIESKTNLGYAGAHKISAKLAIQNNFDLLWILNNDVEVLPQALSELVGAFKRNGEALFGSIALDQNAVTIRFGGGLEMLDRITPDEKSGYNIFEGKNIEDVEMKDRPVSGVQGSSFLIPISVIKKFGFLKTRLFLYGEETEYCYRLRTHGLQTLIVPSSQVIHPGGESFKIDEKLKWVRAYYSTRNNNIVLNKYLKEYKIINMRITRLPHYLKYFFQHFFITSRKEKDFNYWLEYYTELGNFHSLLRIKGKYIDPNKLSN